MIIQTVNIVTFFFPDEYQLAEQFRKEHPDWKEEVTTQGTTFTERRTFVADMRGNDNE